LAVAIPYLHYLGNDRKSIGSTRKKWFVTFFDFVKQKNQITGYTLKNQFLTRMTSLVLAFGFFISCTGTQPVFTGNITEQSSEVLLSRGLELIEQSPASAAGYHYAGYAHYLMAADASEDERPPIYNEMRTYLDAAQQRYSSGNDVDARNHIRDLLTEAWSKEFTLARDLVPLESPVAAAELETARYHALNASIIAPDSVHGHVLLSDIYLHLNDLAAAAEALEPLKHHPSTQAGAYYERIAWINSQTGNYAAAGEWYRQSIAWMQAREEQSLLPTGNNVARGSLLNAYHGAINTFSEAGFTEQAIYYLEQLASVIEENGIYHEMLIVQYFNRMRTYALDEAGSLNMEIINENLEGIRRSQTFVPGTSMYTAGEFTDLASGHIDLQVSQNPDFELNSDLISALLLEEARSLYKLILQSEPDNEDAIYGMSVTFSVIGDNETAEYWLQMLDN
jgi:tetratricopeptide (TPR) repeat protein